MIKVMKIDVEKHFVPSAETVDAILGDYGMSLEDYRFPETGMQNTTLLVATSLGAYALRIYRQGKKDDPAIENEIHLMQHLHTDSIPVPAVVPTTFGQLMTHLPANGTRWQAVLMEALPGDNPDNYDSNIVDKTATIQARMHESSQRFLPPHQEPCVGVLDEQPFIGLIDQESLSDSRLVAFLDRAREYTVELQDELPQGWCHLDLNKQNLLTNEKGEITGVLDFDNAADVPYVMDLAYALWAVHFYADEQRVAQYASTYEQHRSLSAVEMAYLPRIMLYKNYVTASMAVTYGYQNDPIMDRFFSIEASLLSA
jgi:Ser/Thr protein kinase RdoA (MazF antagonist)